MDVEVSLNVSLARYLPGNGSQKTIHLSLEADSTVQDIFRHLEIPEKNVKLIFINGVHTTKQVSLSDGDRVGMFPPLGGG